MLVNQIRSKLKSSTVDWNNRFPLDRWWRKKYSISFLSEAHRKSTFFNQYFEYLEDEVYKDYFDKKRKEENGEIDITKYEPMTGNWWKSRAVSKKEADDWFKTPI